MTNPPQSLAPGQTTLSDADLAERALRFSRYAQRLVQNEPAQLATLRAGLRTPWDAVQMQALLAEFEIADEAALKTALRVLRKRVMLRLIARDLAGLADLGEVMATATLLAETTVCFALDRLSRWLVQQHGEPVSADSGEPQDLIVIGMGKLGGGELNVSSDIDLIFAYPEDGETTGPRRISNHEYFTLLGRKLIGALNELTADGYVFRVDMRLRPYGDSGPLAGSFAMLEDYYQSQGREWERYAWIKGRAICGQRGEELVRMLRPFVFRKYLDFGAFASMRELHAQIRQEVRRRELSDNIKLGPGGIREIEFTAQVFQLIRGGRDALLQIRPTLAVLDVLGRQNRLLPQTVEELRQAYVFLRNLEHRLQYLEDAQTQTLPANPEDRELIAAAMGFADHAAFREALDAHRARVERHFEQAFAAPQSEQEIHPLAPLWLGTPEEAEAAPVLEALGYRQPAASWRRLLEIRQSSRYGQMPDTSRRRFDALLPPLIEVAGGSPNPDETLERILNLLEAVSRRESYLALLLEYPQTLNQVAKLCSASPWAAEYLAQRPILLDELLDTRALYAPPDWAQMKTALEQQLDAADGDTERQMDELRHFKHAQVFRLLAQDLAGLLPVEILSDHLSALADLILEQTLRLAWAGLRARHRETPRFAVIGYGKLGGKELGYASDLDIIFLYADDADEAPEVYARLAQRINTWLGSLTSAGTLYETDLRLRPNGASGLLVSSVEAFAEYQKKQAWVWEHQALTRARFCAGDAAVGEAFEAIRRDVLTQQRDPAALRQEVLAMRQKMLDAHPNASGLFDIKHDRGGIVDVEFAVQYLVLAHAHHHPELTRNIGNLALLKLAGELGLIPPDLAENARAAYRQFRRWQHELRLQGAQYARIEEGQSRSHVAAVKALWEAVFGRQEV
ncbi:MAG: bifunctional [glutamate--ammonia ligase]-adenylyl-L-tyrosine phosphorylase/[glutamate--ammonia-ligase] adenylyltransferase [Pseudomonadota bacterium]